MDEAKEFLNGNIKISDEVIETIASVAVSEIEGVSSIGAGLVDGIARRLTKKPTTSGIKASVGEESTSIDINIVVKYGVRIPEVAWNVQDAVKREIELMTGLNVEKVNVRIVGIDIPAEEETEDIENTTDEE
ncbi:MAG: Asp23/Gls24 family envelope stress response protein [Clostridia bacterium]|nr:Asp23/Gls24 family envelope stress response protein [Clostridia bacterium]